MLQTVQYCPNCKSIMKIFLIELDGKYSFHGIYVCPVCHIIPTTEEWLKEIIKYGGVRKRNITKKTYRKLIKMIKKD